MGAAMTADTGCSTGREIRQINWKNNNSYTNLQYNLIYLFSLIVYFKQIPESMESIAAGYYGLTSGINKNGVLDYQKSFAAVSSSKFDAFVQETILQYSCKL